jgi:transaldolase
MKFYLDSADARQWALPAGCPQVQGVTTNPTLVMQAGLPVSLSWADSKVKCNTCKPCKVRRCKSPH